MSARCHQQLVVTRDLLPSHRCRLSHIGTHAQPRNYTPTYPVCEKWGGHHQYYHGQEQNYAGPGIAIAKARRSHVHDVQVVVDTEEQLDDIKHHQAQEEKVVPVLVLFFAWVWECIRVIVRYQRVHGWTTRDGE